jgi:DNA-binding NarL/FixJ family response regulator
MNDSIRVVLADDHVLVRAGIRSLLERIAGVEIMGEAGTGHEVLRLLEFGLPDIILMDIWMPELNGLDTAARVRAKFPEVRVVMLSVNSAEEYVLQALRIGAKGYLLKNAGPMQLELAIRAVVRGETFLDSAVSRKVIEAYSRRTAGSGSSFDRLTSRQRAVLQLVAEGCTSKQIATKLEISPKTVEMHRADLMSTLDIHDVAGLVRFAIRVGLITSDH